MSLKKQTFSGLIWTFADTFLVRGASFIATLLLARLLGPSEFGLIGMISVFIAIGISLVDSGLSSSLIRTKDADDKDYSTVFYLNLAMSLLVYVILFFTAPYIARFYGQELLIDIIRVYCLGFLITAFTAVQIALLNKEMKFQKLMHYNIPGTITGMAVGLILGYNGYGVWSIVWMYLSNQIVQSIIVWSFSSWKPSGTFSKEKLIYHYSFGYKLLLSGLLDTIFKNIYNVLIGKFFSLKSLGYYERANALNEYPVMTITGIISKVSYPLLARIQEEKERLATVYRQLLLFTFFIITPLMLGSSAIAEPLFLLVLGEQWLPAVPFFKIICLAAIFFPIHSLNINVLKIYGRTDLFLKLEVIKKFTTSISILIAFQFGILALVWSMVFNSVLSLLINTYYSREMINYKMGRQFLDMLPVLLISGIVYILMTWLTNLLGNHSLLVQILAPSLAGALLYGIINYIIKAEPILFTLTLLKERNL